MCLAFCHATGIVACLLCPSFSSVIGEGVSQTSARLLSGHGFDAGWAESKMPSGMRGASRSFSYSTCDCHSSTPKALLKSAPSTKTEFQLDCLAIPFQATTSMFGGLPNQSSCRTGALAASHSERQRWGESEQAHSEELERISKISLTILLPSSALRFLVPPFFMGNRSDGSDLHKALIKSCYE